jgi:membrane protein required for beta-lactamase induction
MALIAILLSLTLERLLGAMEGLRNFRWFGAWSAWVHRQLPREAPWQGAAGVVALLLPPLLLVVLLFNLLDDFWMPLSFLAGVMVLLYCMGPKDLEAEVEAFIEARERDDEESALWHASALLGGHVPDNSRVLTRTLVENILAEANGRLIAVFFWFALLGPLGAMLYRLSAMLQQAEAERGGELAEAIQHLMKVLDWVPARLCAIGYALSGNFVEAVHGWRDDAGKWADYNRGVLLASGLGAMSQMDDERAEEDISPERETARISETMALVRRMVLVLLAFLALLTLGGWTS